MIGGHKVGGDVPAPRTGRMVGGDVPAPRNELAVCCLVAVVSLTVAAACHRLAPGFGLVFKPLLWPLLALPFAVRPRYALVTSAVVPLISCALTGMPTLPVALTLSAMATVVTTVFAVLIRTVGRDVSPRRNHNATQDALGTRLRSAEDVRPYHTVGGDVPAPRTVVGGDVPAPRNRF